MIGWVGLAECVCRGNSGVHGRAVLVAGVIWCNKKWENSSKKARGKEGTRQQHPTRVCVHLIEQYVTN